MQMGLLYFLSFCLNQNLIWWIRMMCSNSHKISTYVCYALFLFCLYNSIRVYSHEAFICIIWDALAETLAKFQWSNPEGQVQTCSNNNKAPQNVNVYMITLMFCIYSYPSRKSQYLHWQYYSITNAIFAQCDLPRNESRIWISNSWNQYLHPPPWNS